MAERLVTFRGEKRWTIDFRVGGERIREASPVNSERGARAYFKQRQKEERAKLNAAPAPAPGPVPAPVAVEPVKKPVSTFNTFAQKFLDTYVATNNKHSERQSKEAVLRLHLRPFFGSMRLDEIGQKQIEEFKARQVKGIGLKKAPTKKTINNRLTVLRKVLVTACEWEEIDTVPHIRWLKTGPSDFDFLTFEEAANLITAADDEWSAMIMVAVRTGLRIGELRALRWEDVDLVKGVLTVKQNVVRGVVGTPKSGKGRVVSLSADTVRFLKAHRHLRGELVYCKSDGSRHTKNGCKWPLWRACKGAGIRRIGWHVLRHTFASHLAMRGVPLKIIQELLGHSTIDMTMRYAHLSPDIKQNAVQCLDEPVQNLGKQWANKGADLSKERKNPASLRG